MREQVILRTVARLMVPFIVLYALYVIFHGEGGPGGGFQGGVIIGGAVALHGMIQGRDATRARLPKALWDTLCGLGVAVYAGTGFLCILLGGKHLEYGVLARFFEHGPAAGATPHGAAGVVSQAAWQHANHYGVFAVEMGVAITVTAVMCTLYFEIARPAPRAEAGQ